MKNARSFIDQAVGDSLELKKKFFAENAEEIIKFYEVLSAARSSGSTVWIFGNGGSAADAQHFAAELMHRVEQKRIGLRAHALHADTSLITAIANDEGYDQIYAVQLRTLAKPGDVAVAISTSGQSTNIVKGLRVARELGCTAVGLLGRDGGQCAALCNLAVVVKHRSTPRIQEVHGMIIHLVCQMLENI